MTDRCEERRAEERSIIDKFYSVEFSLPDCAFVYQFKILNLSSKGLCVLVREDSDLINHIKVGDILNLKYYPTDSLKPVEFLRTQIKHITRDDRGSFKGVFLVGLAILEQ